MAIYMVKCPECGSATELNDEKDFCFCTECGMRIPKEDAELFVPDPAPGTEAPEADAPDPDDSVGRDAHIAASPAPDDSISFGVGIPDDPGAPPIVSPDDIAPVGHDAHIVPPDAPAAPAFDVPELPNAEQLSWLMLRQPQPLDSVVFHSSDECAAYVTDLHSLILEAQVRYSKMNHLEEATCLDFLDRAMGYCDMLDTKRLKFLAGTHMEKSKVVEDYGSYPVSKDVFKDIKQAREDFLEAYNGFFKPKIAAAKEALDETKQKIRDLPAAMRFYHAFCTPVMGILTAIWVAVGIFAVVKGGASVMNIAILAVGAILFVTWAVLMVLWLMKGSGARQLYKAAERQVTELRGYKAKLRN